MEHVWNVLDGNIYVSKNGNDTTGGGTMAAPYASINKATTVGANGNKIVIGTGIWQEARGASTNGYSFYGDGEVVFYGSNTYYFSASYKDTYFFNIIFREYNSRFWLNTGYAVNSYDIKFENCNIEGNYRIDVNSGASRYLRFNKCVLNITRNWLSGSVSAYESSIIVDRCTILKMDCSYDAFSSLQVFLQITNSIISGKLVGLSFNNIIFNYNLFYKYSLYYTIYISGTYYLCTSLSDLQVRLTNANSRELNPKLNNPEIGDYTLKSDSPCLFAGKNNSNIGAFGLGYSFSSNSSEFTKEGGAIFSQTLTVDDIIRTSQTINGITRFLFQLASGHASGNVESTWIDLQQIRYLLITRLFANLIFNASSGVATSRADNLETAGEKAVYYDFELKYCNEESEKAAASYKNVIWNQAVTIDNAGNGNASGSFTASQAKYISARFLKIKMYIKET